MLRSLVIVSTILFSVPLFGQSPEDRLAKSIVNYRQFLLAEHRSLIDGAKKSKRGKEAADYSKRLKTFEKSPPFVPLLFPGRIKIGDIGYLRGGMSGEGDDINNTYQVRYVMDDTTFVAWRGETRIVDELIRSLPQSEVYLIISGLSTTGLTDDKYVRLPQIFEVVGTDKFAGRTAFKLQPFAIQNPATILGRLNAKLK